LKYRVITYQTLLGEVQFVDIGNHSYGEWVIYLNNRAKYHVNIYRPNSESDNILKELIEKFDESITTILDSINSTFNVNLKLSSRPSLEVIKNSELKELNLYPLPKEWLLHLIVTN